MKKDLLNTGLITVVDPVSKEILKKTINPITNHDLNTGHTKSDFYWYNMFMVT